MLSLLAQEKEDISWQAVIHRVPWARGILAWAVRAGTNSLATHDNLVRWDVRVDSKCEVQDCCLPSNLGHLNGCNRSVDRFQFRHDSVLAHLSAIKAALKPETMKVYADLEGWQWWNCAV